MHGGKMLLDDASLLDFDVDVDLGELLGIPKVGATATSGQENAGGAVRSQNLELRKSQSREQYCSLDGSSAPSSSRSGLAFREESVLDFTGLRRSSEGNVAGAGVNRRRSLDIREQEMQLDEPSTSLAAGRTRSVLRNASLPLCSSHETRNDEHAHVHKKSRTDNFASLLEGIDDIDWDMEPLELSRPVSSSPQVQLDMRTPEVVLRQGQSQVHSVHPSAVDVEMTQQEGPQVETIPGPAGALLMGKSTDYSHLSWEKQPTHTPASDFRDFNSKVWLNALKYFQINELDPVQYSRRESTIRHIKSSRELNRVSQLVAIIKTCTPNGCGDAFVTLQDPTGFISGTIHRKLLAETEYGRDIVPGAVILLCKVAVFRPSPRAQYLNITINNVVQVFRKESS